MKELRKEHKKELYYVSTFAYWVVAVVAIYFVFFSIVQSNWVLGLISLLAIYVALDNVYCRDRKRKAGIKVKRKKR